MNGYGGYAVDREIGKERAFYRPFTWLSCLEPQRLESINYVRIESKAEQ